MIGLKRIQVLFAICGSLALYQTPSLALVAPFWDIQFNKRPEIIIRADYDDLSPYASFSQNMLFGFHTANKIKMGLGGEFTYIPRTTKGKANKVVGLRMRLNYYHNPQTIFFFDTKAYASSDLSFLGGWSHAGKWLYYSLFMNFHTRDPESPQTWNYHTQSILGNLSFSLLINEIVYLTGYLLEKSYKDDMHNDFVHKWQSEQGIDIYVLGKPSAITKRIFDRYEDLHPYSYNRSLVLGLGNFFENHNDTKISLQKITLTLSFPINAYYGFSGSIARGKNLLSLTNDKSSMTNYNLGMFLYFTHRLGCFLRFNSFKQTVSSTPTQNMEYSISCNLNF